MNIFSRIKNAVVGALGLKARPTVQEGRDKKLHFKSKPMEGHTIRFRTGGTIHGPAFPPRTEHHHASRQTCRAYLRTLFFGKFTQDYPLASRRQRRRIARLAASLEYRQMMRDNTNVIPATDAAVAGAA